MLYWFSLVVTKYYTGILKCKQLATLCMCGRVREGVDGTPLNISSDFLVKVLGQKPLLQ